MECDHEATLEGTHAHHRYTIEQGGSSITRALRFESSRAATGAHRSVSFFGRLLRDWSALMVARSNCTSEKGSQWLSLCGALRATCTLRPPEPRLVFERA